ncbi:pentatricopeptide repeat-containing protein At4g17616 isoform X3 [Capsella rubella]|uniref:pentatricopeptide repeat-containing protein At4g17616 isoform X3 n=1 Tax=Capsella rubella TaxID=81985 RepID=UPI000CD5C931|nr:pentatricopeptide repeat-containing protein At4g17616 isoform X3 [Capsella rubella]
MFRKRNLVLESLHRFDVSNVETLISRVLCSSTSKSSLFCTSVEPGRLSWEVSSQVILKKKLEIALKDHRVDDAWDVFKDFKRLYGFPDSVVMNSIIRIMLEKGYVLTSDVLRLVVMHMVKTEVGTCLASNYLVQVCDRFVGLNVSKRNNSTGNVMKPDTVLFNLVLGSCVRFGLSLKGQELIELMAKVDVIADAYTIVIMSCIYEMNAMRDELRKVKEHIGQLPPQLLCHYRHLFDNLLSLEFKFDDIGSACRLVLDICKSKDLLSDHDLGFDSEKPRVLPVGSHHIRSGLKIQISPKLLQRDSSHGVDTEATFVNYANSKLVITKKTLAKLVYGYKRHDNLPELSKLLFSLGGSSLCADVVDAFVAIGWLEAAHDILDDMVSAGHPLELDTYRKVLSGYYKSKMLRNAEVLLKQMTKVGLITDPSDEIVVLPETEEKDSKTTELMDFLVQEIDAGKQVSSMLYELNSSLYYFCKAKMQEDALITYRKIPKMKVPPTVQSFWILTDMYSSLGMYREITIVWGDIKRNIASSNLKVTQDLLEKIVVNFIRGGYFERIMELISYMKENDMYNDLTMYKNEYLKLHKNLYRTLKAADAVNEAQAQRLEHVKAFRKLVGIV